MEVVTPTLLRRAVDALTWASQARIAEALGLSGGREKLWDMTRGRRSAEPGVVLDLAQLMRERAAELIELASELEAAARPEAGGLHGLTASGRFSDLDAIGHVTSHEVLQHGPAWLAGYDRPAEVLRQRVAVELADGGLKMPALTARRLLAALGRLTDAQAMEVAQAAADVADLAEG
jgi:hypothetical protein